MKELLDVGIIKNAVVAGIMGIIVIGWFYLFSSFKDADISNVLTSSFLYLTFVVLIWYSWETRQLKIETRRLRKLATADSSILKKQSITDIRPYLRLQRVNSDRYLQLINEGKGIAVNLEPVYVKGRKHVSLLRIPAMAAAPNSNTSSFVPTSFPSNEELDPELGLYMIRIKYEDIEGRRYEAIFQSDVEFNDKFSIISQSEIFGNQKN